MSADRRPGHDPAPISFRLAKKRVLRAKKAKQATENAVKFGQTKAEKQAELRRAEKAARHLDGHKREDE